MLIRSLSLKEFRGIKSCDKPLKFSKFTVLIGRNNSGKSTILQALYLLPDPLSGSAIPFNNKRRDYLNATIKNPVYGYSGIAEIRYNDGDAKLRINENFGVDLFKIKDREFKGTERWDPAKSCELFGVRSSEEFSVLIPNDTQVLQQIDGKITNLQNKIMKSGAHIRVARLISECVADNYTEILPDTLKIRKELPDGNVHYIRIEDLGDGARKAVKLMLLLEVIKPKLVLWDDFEASAHPSLIKILLSWLSQNHWQVVLSTHSIDVLYGLLDAEPEGAKILQLHKDEEDILHHRTLTLEDVEDFMSASLDPRLMADLLKL
ncbi:MAG: ATP-binding protein [Euryarchaeota archaeon]|nr:ATP-binding protein [Euryarchaeota archaeon]